MNSHIGHCWSPLSLSCAREVPGTSQDASLGCKIWCLVVNLHKLASSQAKSPQRLLTGTPGKAGPSDKSLQPKRMASRAPFAL